MVFWRVKELGLWHTCGNANDRGCIEMRECAAVTRLKEILLAKGHSRT